MKDKKTRVCLCATPVYGTGGTEVMITQLANYLSKTMEVYILSDNDKTESKLEISPEIKVKSILSEYNYAEYKKIDYYLKHLVRIIVRLMGTRNTTNIIGQKINDYVEMPPKKCKRLAKYINEIEPDITIGVGRGAVLLGKIADMVPGKKIGWQHSCYDGYMNKNGINTWPNINKLSAQYLSKLDKHVVLTDYDKEDFSKNEGIETVAIPNFMNEKPEVFSDVQNHKMIAVGRLSHEKQYDLLLKAWSLFKEDNNDWVLEIYGEGPKKEQLSNDIIDLKVKDSVKLCGFTKDIHNKIKDSSALIVTSKYEGFPLGVLEAMTIGVPIVGFDISALKYLVEDGKEGYLVKSYDVTCLAEGLRKIASDAQIRKNMSNLCKEKVKQYEKETVLKQWDTLLKNIVRE